MSHSANTTTTATATTASTLENTSVLQQVVRVSSATEDNVNDAAAQSPLPLHDRPPIISRFFTLLLAYLSVLRFAWIQNNTYSLWPARSPARTASATQVMQNTPLPDSPIIIIDRPTITDGLATEARPGIRGHQKHGISKEISTVTKLLFGVSVAAILLNANGSKEYNSLEACVERTIHLMAIILMIVGIYIRVYWPTSSKWLQRVGQFMSLFCLIIIHTPLLKLPLPFSCLLLILLSIILVPASYFSA